MLRYESAPRKHCVRLALVPCLERSPGVTTSSTSPASSGVDDDTLLGFMPYDGSVDVGAGARDASLASWNRLKKRVVPAMSFKPPKSSS